MLLTRSPQASPPRPWPGVHTDLEAGFIRGVDGRTRRVVGADHQVEDGDVPKIHAKT